jgi:hypothetical protein
MKRLLLGPALIAPLALFGCSNWGTKVPELPKVPEVIREIPLEDFEHFPPVKAPEAILAPQVPKRTHAPRHHTRPTPRPVHRPVAPVAAPEDTLPPQQGPICIFPFSMIPNCTPQVAGQ